MPQNATKSNGQAKTPPHHRKRQEAPKERPKTAKANQSHNGKANNGNQTTPNKPTTATTAGKRTDGQATHRQRQHKPHSNRQAPNGGRHQDSNGTSQSKAIRTTTQHSTAPQRWTAEQSQKPPNPRKPNTLDRHIYIYYIMSNICPKSEQNDFVFFF